MNYDNWRSLPAMFFAQAERFADKPFLWSKREGRYRPLSWAQAARDVRRLALGLRSLGIGRGERVGLVSENRPEWIIADFAIMSAGAITVPAYVTHSIDEHRHVFANSAARAVIVSKPALSGRVLAAANQVDAVQTVIAMEPTAGQASAVDLLSWDEMLSRGSAQADDTGEVVAAIEPDDVACLIYTSGTGGTPKGVMMTHRNILANCRGAHRVLEILGLGNDVFLSFLPLSHSYEHTAGAMFPISIGAQIYFAEGAETLAANLLEARPTIMTAVPRLYETMHQRIRLGVEHRGGVAQKLFDRALAIGRKRLKSQTPSLGERVLDQLCERSVRAKFRRRFGGRLKAMVSGGAPLNPEIAEFFLALGVRLLQGYGQTEAGPVITCNRPGRTRTDTVGPPLDGVRVCIADDGEVLVTGDNVMKGYWNDPEATARALVDGWLHTGDVGSLDHDGYLRITDRKRDFIKTSGGEMISPARVEGYLTLQPEIAQAMVIGDRHPYLVAVLAPDPAFVAGFAAQGGTAADLTALATDPGFNKAIGAAVSRVNQTLSASQRVRRFVIATEPFTTTNGQMTPTLKIKRHVIREVYGAALDALYESKVSALEAPVLRGRLTEREACGLTEKSAS
ncbi:MAG: long-chain fatty acid--CoA ligase [Alphaproteobacteria bacterium]|nr:long-chain fatty acid--CoA ligase [Alphaproteobacteria bacterium]